LSGDRGAVLLAIDEHRRVCSKRKAPTGSLCQLPSPPSAPSLGVTAIATAGFAEVTHWAAMGVALACTLEMHALRRSSAKTDMPAEPG
jgi:hypothetical protein